MSQQHSVTIVVLTRDRFSLAEESLESVFENTDYPYEMIYVDGGSPKHVYEYLKKRSKEKNFKLIRRDYFMSPNEARNVALQEDIKSDYIVFVDNDLVPVKGWLGHLVDCAEQTGCAVVCPLTCEDRPLHENIHYAGGEASVKEEVNNGIVERHLFEKMNLYKSKVSQVRNQLVRKNCGFTEFHCFLARRTFLERIDQFDEEIPSSREHLDFALRVQKAGGEIYFEPNSVVTFVTHFASKPPELSDMHYFMLRWSDAWEYQSLKRMVSKWNLTEGKYFTDRYKSMGWRRKYHVISAFTNKIKPRIIGNVLAKVLSPCEKMLNRAITKTYSKQHQQRKNLTAVR